jgi:hypothetical protein
MMDVFLSELQLFVGFIKDLVQSICGCLQSEQVDKPIITYNWDDLGWVIDIEMIERKYWDDMI